MLSSIVDMSPNQPRFKIPVFGWLLGGLVLIAIVLLILPSNKQKQVRLALERLDRDFACPESIARLIREKQLIETQVPKNTSTAIGAPAEPKGQNYESPVRVVCFWNPSVKRPLDSYDIDFLSLGSVGASYMGDLDAQFPGRTVVVTPVDNTFDQEVLATALILWVPDRDKGSYLDSWRVLFRDSKTRPSAISHMKRALAKESAERLDQAARTLKQNREVCKSIPNGALVYVDARERYYLVKSGLKYDFESTWNTAYRTNR